MKGIKGLLVFAVCMWGIVVTTYAVPHDFYFNKPSKFFPMDGSNCSSSGPTSSGTE